MSSLFSPVAASGNTSYVSCSCNQRGLYLSKKQACKSEAEKPSYVESCFPSFRIVHFYMFSRVSSKRGFESRGQTSHRDPWRPVSVISPPRGFPCTDCHLYCERLFARQTHMRDSHPFLWPTSTAVWAKPQCEGVTLVTCSRVCPLENQFSYSSGTSESHSLPPILKSGFCLGSLLKLEASLLLPLRERARRMGDATPLWPQATSPTMCHYLLCVAPDRRCVGLGRVLKKRRLREVTWCLPTVTFLKNQTAVPVKH